MLPRFDAEYIGSQMEIGVSTELDIDGVTRKVDLAAELSLELPTQVEVFAEEAGACLAQGGTEILDGGWSWPTHRYRLLANERRIINLQHGRTCLACLQSGAATGTLLITETRIR